LRQKDLCPIQYTRVCQRTGEEVAYEEIIRGYEYQKGDYLVLTEKDLEEISFVNPKTVEIVQFAADEISPQYFEKPYLLEPAEGSERAYALLREALKRSGKVGIARFVLRARPRLGVLRGENEALYLNRIRFAGELRSTKEFKLPLAEEIKVGELDLAVRLIDYLSTPFRATEYEDVYLKRLSAIIEEKTRKKLPSPLALTEGELLQRLEESLKRVQK